MRSPSEVNVQRGASAGALLRAAAIAGIIALPLGVSGALAIRSEGSGTAARPPVEDVEAPGTELINEKIVAELVYEVTYPGGATEGAGRAVTSLPLPGGTGGASGGVGFPRSLAPGLCMNFTSGGMPLDEELRKGARHAWEARFETLSADMRKLEVAVDWTRWDNFGDTGPQRAKGDRRVLSLEQGERHLLDFVDVEPEDDWYCGRNTAVYVELDVREDPELADERIAYELWLIIEDEEGRRTTRRALASGAQGELVDFSFAEVRWPLPGAFFAGGLQAEAVGDFSAKVRGRLRPDGSIALDLHTGRTLSVAPEGRPYAGSIGDGGRRIVGVAPGEAIELVLPETMGSATQFLPGTADSEVMDRLQAITKDPPEDWPGYAADSGHIFVHNPTYFAEMRMSLILTATRER